MPRLMPASLNDHVAPIRSRYSRRTGKLPGSRLLDEFCKVTGFERKYAIKVLGNRRRCAPSRRRGAKPTYLKEDIAILKKIWLLAGVNAELKPVR